MKKDDQINHPKHYTYGRIETIEAIEDWDLGYHLGNTIKYISRHMRKGKPLEDLKKAKFYLDRKIWLMERELKKKKQEKK